MKSKYNLRQAMDLLYSGGSASSEAYTAIVLECVRNNDYDQAERLQLHMETHSFQPKTTFIHNRLLHIYAKTGKVSSAKNLFDKMPRRDVFSYNAMLSAYSKSGSVDELQATFDEMSYRDSVSYNTIIMGLAGNGFSIKALDMFVRMQTEGMIPSEYTYVSALHACSQLINLRLGRQIQGRITVINLGGNVFIWNALTSMYAKCGDIGYARWLFDRANNKNLVSWNSMISGYLKTGHPEKSLDLFNNMQLLGFKPDKFTFSDVLTAYFQIGNINEAGKTFNEIKDKDKVLWTTMIAGYAQNGKEEDALSVFNEMIMENVIPDKFTFSSVVNSCAKLASLCYGKTVHAKAVVAGVHHDLLVASALIDMYSKCGDTENALIIFSIMTNRNVVSWNAMILGYAQNGHDLDALTLYEQMLQEGLKPDTVTFVGVLSSCIHANLVELGQRYFDSISQLHKLIPTLDHYACMINLLGRLNISQAVDLIKSMPHEPNSLIWSTLLSVCSIKGNIEIGQMAANYLFEIDPLNAGPYIVLSNMYASHGRWKDVASIRSLMKKNKVKKYSAYSWIEIDKRVRKFVSEDHSHPETEGIYKELSELISRLKKEGFTSNTKFVLHDVNEEEKFESISYHSEKIALAYGLMKTPNEMSPIRIIKNLRVCGDCHLFMKYVSKIVGRTIILRDSNRFHHFVGGNCCCKDYW